MAVTDVTVRLRFLLPPGLKGSQTQALTPDQGLLDTSTNHHTDPPLRTWLTGLDGRASTRNALFQSLILSSEVRFNTTNELLPLHCTPSSVLEASDLALGRRSWETNVPPPSLKFPDTATGSRPRRGEPILPNLESGRLNCSRDLQLPTPGLPAPVHLGTRQVPRCRRTDLTQAKYSGVLAGCPDATVANNYGGSFAGPESSAPSPDPASGRVSLVSSPQSQSLSPKLVPRRSDSALTARVRPERHQHEVVREPRHGKGRRRAPRLEDSMAARSWPDAGPKLHTWDTPGPLLCGAADQGFRRHLPSQPARPGASGACAVLPLPCRRDLTQCTSIGPLHVGRVQRELPRLQPLAQGPAQPFGRVKLTAAGAGQLPRSRGRHFDLKHRSGLGHTSPSKLKPQKEGRPGPHPGRA